MYITSSGQESSPRINFGVTSNSWYKLKSVVNGTNVKVYVNGNLASMLSVSNFSKPIDKCVHTWYTFLTNVVLHIL